MPLMSSNRSTRRGLLAAVAAIAGGLSLAAAPADAALVLVTNTGNNTVSQYDGTTVTPFANTGAVPIGIDLDPANNVYVAQLGAAAVTRFDPTGTISTPFASVAGATGLTVGPDNTVYVGSANDQGGDGSVRRFDLAGNPLPSIPGNGGVRGLTFANNGHLFVADLVGSVVREYDATLTQVGSYSTPAFPQGLATGPDGAVYVASANFGTGPGGGGVYRLNGFTPGSTFSLFAEATGDASQVNRAIGLGFDPDSALLYVTNLTNDRLDRYNGTTGAFVDSVGGFSDPAGVTFVPEPVGMASLLVAGGFALLRRRGATGAR